MSAEQYTDVAATVAPGFAAWPGLVAKYWLADPEQGTYGGVYLFEDEGAARRSRETPEFTSMADNPALVDVEVREFATIDQLDAVTAPGRVITPA
jgi:hypothetical protein